MNKISLVLNVILLAAVGFLFYYVFSNNKNAGSKNNTNQASAATCTTQHHIAYVELDSLNENLLYFKQKRKDLEAQQKAAEAEITNEYKSLEAQQNNFIQKNPNASPEEVQNFRAFLAKGQQDIEIKKQNRSQALSQQNFELIESIQKDLKKFLADYNKEKQYQYIFTTGSGMDYLIYKDSTMDITRDVIKGMNEMRKPTANK